MTDREKLISLKEEIEQKQEELRKEIIEVLQNYADDTTRVVLEMRLVQCNAQLRLIEYILDDFSNDKYIIY